LLPSVESPIGRVEKIVEKKQQEKSGGPAKVASDELGENRKRVLAQLQARWSDVAGGSDAAGLVSRLMSHVSRR